MFNEEGASVGLQLQKLQSVGETVNVCCLKLEELEQKEWPCFS